MREEYKKNEEIKDNINDMVDNLIEYYYTYIYINGELENLLLELLGEGEEE